MVSVFPDRFLEYLVRFWVFAVEVGVGDDALYERLVVVAIRHRIVTDGLSREVNHIRYAGGKLVINFHTFIILNAGLEGNNKNLNEIRYLQQRPLTQGRDGSRMSQVVHRGRRGLQWT